MPMATTSELRERVAKGAQAFDATTPNWYRCVDTTDLRMSEYDKCVLGWVFAVTSDNRYMRRQCEEAALDLFIKAGIEVYALDPPRLDDRLVEYGFALWPESKDSYTSAEIDQSPGLWDVMHDAWIEEIEKRRNG